MNRISLVAYSIRVRRKRTSYFLKLRDIDGVDLFSCLKHWTKPTESQMANFEESKQVMDFSEQDVLEKRETVTGIVETGEYGFESKLFDVKKRKIAYKRTVDDAEVLPFYFQIFAPNEEIGIVVFQRFGNLGISSVFRKWFRSQIDSVSSEFTVDMDPLIPDEYFRAILTRGDLSTITFRKLTVPSDIADRIDPVYLDPQEAKYEIIVKSKNPMKDLARRIMSKLNGRQAPALHEIVSLPNADFDEIIVTIKIGGVEKRFNLARLSNVQATLDITNNVRMGANGHPAYGDVQNEALNYCDHLKKQLRL